jgi:hypothetical protein
MVSTRTATGTKPAVVLPPLKKKTVKKGAAAKAPAKAAKAAAAPAEGELHVRNRGSSLAVCILLPDLCCAVSQERTLVVAGGLI